MQHGSGVSSDREATDEAQIDCAFCQCSRIATYILKETPGFRLVADHAPLVEGHLLIIPKTHYACYGAVSAELDEELFSLKREVQQFLEQFYAPVIFWEHGVFRQTVFHAHLHCFPFGEITYDLSNDLHDLVVTSQEDIRAWYATQGQYFYLEDSKNALLFSPRQDYYQRILQEVLLAGASSRLGHTHWRSPQQRLEEGKALIQATAAQWQTFQKQGVPYADQTSQR